jgi:hypothetical protein
MYNQLHRNYQYLINNKQHVILVHMAKFTYQALYLQMVINLVNLIFPIKMVNLLLLSTFLNS